MADDPPLPGETFDVIVVGAGLAGLAAALRLQRAGQRVLVIDRRPTAGGLCGTVRLDGYEFVIGCNEFGRRTARELAALGVPVSFHALASRFYQERGYLRSPPDLRTALGLRRRTPGLLRPLLALRGASAGEYRGPLLERRRVEGPLRDLVSIAAYGMGAPPSALPVEALRARFSQEIAYGYDQATTPAGGPGVLVERMVVHLGRLGERCSLAPAASASRGPPRGGASSPRAATSSPASSSPARGAGRSTRRRAGRAWRRAPSCSRGHARSRGPAASTRCATSRRGSPTPWSSSTAASARRASASTSSGATCRSGRAPTCCTPSSSSPAAGTIPTRRRCAGPARASSRTGSGSCPGWAGVSSRLAPSPRSTG